MSLDCGDWTLIRIGVVYIVAVGIVIAVVLAVS